MITASNSMRHLSGGGPVQLFVKSKIMTDPRRGCPKQNQCSIYGLASAVLAYEYEWLSLFAAAVYCKWPIYSFEKAIAILITGC